MLHTRWLITDFLSMQENVMVGEGNIMVIHWVHYDNCMISCVYFSSVKS